MGENMEKAERPVSITLICALVQIGVIRSMATLVYSSVAEEIGPWYRPYIGLSIVVGLVCLCGLWTMKKWAAYGYTALIAINHIVMFAMGIWDITAILISAIVIFFALKNVSKMT